MLPRVYCYQSRHQMVHFSSEIALRNGSILYLSGTAPTITFSYSDVQFSDTRHQLSTIDWCGMVSGYHLDWADLRIWMSWQNTLLVSPWSVENRVSFSFSFLKFLHQSLFRLVSEAKVPISKRSKGAHWLWRGLLYGGTSGYRGHWSITSTSSHKLLCELHLSTSTSIQFYCPHVSIK